VYGNYVLTDRTTSLLAARASNSVKMALGVLNNLLDRPADVLQEDRKNMMSETATDDVLYCRQTKSSHGT